MSTPAENEAVLREQVSVIPEPLERLNYLVGRARRAPELASSERDDAFKVSGCQSDVWVVPGVSEAGHEGAAELRLRFRSGSDAPVVAALAATLCEIYRDCLPADIVAFEPTLFESIGARGLLTENRRRGIAQIDAKITAYATAQLKGGEER